VYREISDNAVHASLGRPEAKRAALRRSQDTSMLQIYDHISKFIRCCTSTDRVEVKLRNFFIRNFSMIRLIPCVEVSLPSMLVRHVGEKLEMVPDTSLHNVSLCMLHVQIRRGRCTDRLWLHACTTQFVALNRCRKQKKQQHKII
jgi:hypothetical protein